MKVFFQGVIYVPVSRVFYDTTNESLLGHTVTCRVSKITVSFRDFLRACLPLDAYSKLGGPIPAAQYIDGFNKLNSDCWPYTRPPEKKKSSATWPPEESASPADWWRWALLLMYPPNVNRYYTSPQIPTLESMGEMFGGWQLFRHIKTTFAVMATQSAKAFSPVASLLTQDSYFYHRDDKGQALWGQLPMTGAICRNPSASKESDWPADEYYWQAQPPNPAAKPSSASSGVAGTPYQAVIATGKHTMYSKSTFPSFSTLSALGAAWAFPPGQRSVSRRSFNHHSATGAGDPDGKKWHVLVPRKQEYITDASMQKTEVDTVFFTLYLAQGTPATQPYKFMTYTEPLADKSFNTEHWAVIRVRSAWELGNTRRPYVWDVNWWNNVNAINMTNGN